MGSHELSAALRAHRTQAVQLAVSFGHADFFCAHCTLGQKVHHRGHVPRHVHGHVEREQLASEAGGVHEPVLRASVEDQQHTVVVHGVDGLMGRD
eukprot:7136166-Prymnesium_polylepis.1